jgi:excisionase family DNA binding protein
MQSNDSIFLSPDAAADVLGITRTAIFDLVRTGELASIRPGKRRLISRQSLEDWAARQLAAAGFGKDR